MPEAVGEGGSAAGSSSFNALGPRATSGVQQGTADAGELGRLCSVCGLSAGVSLRTHLLWPTPVRPAPDSRVKGRDFQILRERLKSGEDSVGTFWNGNAVPACVESSRQRKGFPDVGGEKQGREIAWFCTCGDMLPFPPCSSPKIKSFRKGKGGAGERGQPFFKRVSPFPRISLLSHPPSFPSPFLLSGESVMVEGSGTV